MCGLRRVGWAGGLAGGAQSVSGERVFACRGFKVLAAASLVAPTDDINDG